MAKFNLDSISYNPLSARSKAAVDYAMKALDIADARSWERRSPTPTPNSRASTKRKGTTYRKRNNKQKTIGSVKAVTDISLKDKTEADNSGYERARARTNLIEHTNGVIRSAQTAPLPKGITRKQFVEAALVHDLGKLFNPTKTHGRTSNWLASQMGIRLNSAQRAAIAKHMDFLENTSSNTSLENALHTADVARGLPYSTIVNRYNYLRY